MGIQGGSRQRPTRPAILKEGIDRPFANRDDPPANRPAGGSSLVGLGNRVETIGSQPLQPGRQALGGKLALLGQVVDGPRAEEPAQLDMDALAGVNDYAPVRPSWNSGGIAFRLCIDRWPMPARLGWRPAAEGNLVGSRFGDAGADLPVLLLDEP